MEEFDVDRIAIVRQETRSLFELADSINSSLSAAEISGRKCVEHYRKAGEELIIAKSQCRHGEYLGWLREHVKCSQPQAWRYMKLAENWANHSLTNDLEDYWRTLCGNDDPKPTHVSHNSGVNEWYTPPEYIEAAREVLGTIDLDPATSKQAQAVVRAKKFYTEKENGLKRAWEGRVWMNPPYSANLIGEFVEKLCIAVESGDVPEAIMLVNNATETTWFQRASEACSGICYKAGRIKFLDESGEPSGAPLQGQAFLYFGDEPDRFFSAFKEFGFCTRIFRDIGSDA